MRELTDEPAPAAALTSAIDLLLRAKGADVATMVVLLDHANGEFCLRPQAAQQLAGLGVTSVAVVGNQQTVGIILEGWLFDPARSACAAAAAVGAPPGAPVLHPILQAAVCAVVNQGGPDVEKVS